ncbi:stress associated endoplasmic reticulum protein, partial [Striga asiatica]
STQGYIHTKYQPTTTHHIDGTFMAERQTLHKQLEPIESSIRVAKGNQNLSTVSQSTLANPFPNNDVSCQDMHCSSTLQLAWTTSRRLADRKVMKFEKNIVKRGATTETSKKKGNSYPVGPLLLGFFIFVVIGSCELFP